MIEYMKKLLYSLIIALACLPVIVSAAPEINGLTDNIALRAGYSASDATDRALPQQIGLIIRVALSLVGTIFLALTVYAGILWMTAQGNDDQVGKARKILVAAVIGMMIALFGYVITGFVTNSLTKSNTNTSANKTTPPTGNCAYPVSEGSNNYCCQNQTYQADVLQCQNEGVATDDECVTNAVGLGWCVKQ